MSDMLLGRKEAAKMFGIPIQSMYDLTRAGVIPVIQFKSVYVRKSSIEKFLSEYDGKDLRDPYNISNVSIVDLKNDI